MKRLFNTLIICLILVTTDTLSVNARTFALIAGVSNYGVEDANLSQNHKGCESFQTAAVKTDKGHHPADKHIRQSRQHP